MNLPLRRPQRSPAALFSTHAKQPQVTFQPNHKTTSHSPPSQGPASSRGLSWTQTQRLPNMLSTHPLPQQASRAWSLPPVQAISVPFSPTPNSGPRPSMPTTLTPAPPPRGPICGAPVGSCTPAPALMLLRAGPLPSSPQGACRSGGGVILSLKPSCPSPRTCLLPGAFIAEPPPRGQQPADTAGPSRGGTPWSSMQCSRSPWTPLPWRPVRGGVNKGLLPGSQPRPERAPDRPPGPDTQRASNSPGPPPTHCPHGPFSS